MKIVHFILAGVAISTLSMFATTNIISQFINGGRFGDHLMTYVRTKMLSDRYGVPFFFTPFEHTELLMMSKYENKFTHDMARSKKKIMKATLSLDLMYDNVHFVCFPYLDGTQDDITRDELYDYMMDNYRFLREIKKMIAPIKPVQPLDLPTNKITVAVHVRKGSGHDRILPSTEKLTVSKNKYENVSNPEKFPEDNYYIEQIRLLAELLEDRQLFVYIFTDDSNPVALMNYYSKCVGKDNVEFACRDSTNSGKSSILEDFFAMAYQFDCLIRGKSAFSYVAQLIGNHKIVIHTKGGEWVDRVGVVIDKVGMVVRDISNNNIKRTLFDKDHYDVIKQLLEYCDWLDNTNYSQQRMSALRKLQSKYKWPNKKPSVKKDDHSAFFVNARQLEGILNDKMCLIVELGPWLGCSTRFILDHAPNAIVLTIDHWKGSAEHFNMPQVRDKLPTLYETFLVNCWEYQKRLIPMKTTTLQGLDEIHACGLQPDFLYIDASHDFQSVMSELQKIHSYFPKSLISGDDWSWPEVRKAVETFSHQYRFRVLAEGNFWMIKK